MTQLDSDAYWTRQSRHAAIRSQQRCIPQVVIDLLLDRANVLPAGGGAERYAFDKATWNKAKAYLGNQAKHFDHYRNAYAVVSGDGRVITSGWRQ